MRRLFFFLLTLLLMSGCNNTPTVEDDLYRCIESEFRDKGINLPGILDSIENQMLDEGLLTEKGGKGIIKYYEKIIETGQVPALKDHHFTQRLVDLKMQEIFNVTCRQKVKDKDSLRFSKSKYNIIMERIQIRLANQGSVSPVTVSKAILEELSAEDFEHPYYRTFALLTFTFIMDKDTSFVRHIPKTLENSGTITLQEKGTMIWLYNGESVVIDNRTVHIDQLAKVFENARTSRDPKDPVYIVMKPETKFDVFMKVQGVIEEYTTKVREKEARKRFSKPYSDLNTQQKQQVDAAHPITVIERIN